MSGETEVVNKALVHLGESRITSLTDGSNQANAANDIYEGLRDELLRAHPWNFATKRVQLARSSTAPAFEFDYAYVLPTDWLRTISVHDNDGGRGVVLHRAEIIGAAQQRAIVASVEELYLRYVYRVTDPNIWTPDFRTVVELCLARDMAVRLTGSNTLHDSMSIRADRMMGKARSTDALDASPELRQRGSWANSRAGRRSSGFTND